MTDVNGDLLGRWNVRHRPVLILTGLSLRLSIGIVFVTLSACSLVLVEPSVDRFCSLPEKEDKEDPNTENVTIQIQR